MPATLRDLHEQFMTEQRYVARRALPTLDAYRTSFDLLVDLMPSISPGHLTTASVTEFFRRLDGRTRRVGWRTRRGVTASTIASHRSRLGRFFSWLRSRGLISSNPFDEIPYPRVDYDRRRYLGRDQIERLFASLALGASGQSRFQRARNLGLIGTLLYTGIRRGELLGLRVTDLNLDRRELSVRGETSKSRRSRVIPVNAPLHRVLEDYLVERRKVPFRSEHLFVSGSGDALTVHGLKHLVRALARRSGVRFHLHQLRHTFAINVLHQSGDVAKLKELLGHRDIRMTSSYLRAIPTRAMRDHVESLTLAALL